MLPGHAQIRLLMLGKVNNNARMYANGKETYLFRIAIIVIFCVFIVSCEQIALEDYSSTPEYSDVIGMKFRVKEDLWAIGITANKNYKKRVDYIVLAPGVGFGGPEVVTKERVSKGIIIRIVGVQKARSPLLSQVIYVVEEIGSDKLKGAVVRVKPTGDVKDPNLGLDDSVYEKIE